ncbi:MAG TPA: TIR domain-containing protein, partial [Xanthomonadales bacterium]|nr:TIR domain-containing protein [Xanthomonadales bacterium]
MSEFRYRAFLSYSHADSRWARWLHHALERYRPPRKLAGTAQNPLAESRRIAPVFRDREELSSGADLSTAVNRALAASEALIVICSPAAARSRWVNEEVLAFRKLGRSDRIFCFLVDGEPNSGDATECLPQALRYQTSAAEDGGLVSPEPLAADARRQGDGRTLAKLKLIAGLLGVGFDELRQRDLQRRYKRMLAITGSSLLVAITTITLAIMTVLATAEAERRRAQAEDLVGFMLGELRESLNEIGRLDVYMEVGNKAMEYFASMADEDVNDTTLSQRAKALRQIGSARLDNGHTAEALESFHEALEISRRLAKRDPENPEWQIALANSYFYIGFVHWRRGELADAQSHFEKVLPIVDQVASRDPHNPDWLAEQSYARTNLGRVLEIRGELEQALLMYEEIASINNRSLLLAPDDVELQAEVGFAHNNIGKLVQSMGRLEDAAVHFEKDLEIKQQVSDSNPRHNHWRDSLARSYFFRGHNQYLRGHLDAARKDVSQALEIVESLLLVDDASMDWMEKAATYALELASIELAQGDVEAARQFNSRASELFNHAVALDPQNVSSLAGRAEAQV